MSFPAYTTMSGTMPDRRLLKQKSGPFTEQHGRAVLQRWFRHASFRDLQWSVIHEVASGKDALGMLPTGGGKTVIAWMPALLREGLCVFLVPLLSLAADMQARASRLGIPLLQFSSEITDTKKAAVIQALQARPMRARVLLTTPESLLGNATLRAALARVYRDDLLSCIAVDEAHCIVSWGASFRPAYSQLGKLKLEFPTTPVLALTATATATTRRAILDSLQVPQATVFASTVDRPNLQFTVLYRDGMEDPVASMAKLLLGALGQGILRAGATNLAQSAGNAWAKAAAAADAAAFAGASTSEALAAQHAAAAASEDPLGALLGTATFTTAKQLHAGAPSSPLKSQAPAATSSGAAPAAPPPGPSPSSKPEVHCGLVYCATRDNTEEIAGALRTAGVKAAHYHAGLSKADKAGVMAQWLAGELVVVATVAMGLGVDNPHTDIVIHYNMPATMQAQLQEWGRAGRAGQRAQCVLLFAREDVGACEFRIRKTFEQACVRADQISNTAERLRAIKAADRAREDQAAELRTMQQFATAVACRRRGLVRAFDEPCPAQHPSCVGPGAVPCDVCEDACLVRSRLEAAARGRQAPSPGHADTAARKPRAPGALPSKPGPWTRREGSGSSASRTPPALLPGFVSARAAAQQQQQQQPQSSNASRKLGAATVGAPSQPTLASVWGSSSSSSRRPGPASHPRPSNLPSVRASSTGQLAKTLGVGRRRKRPAMPGS